MMTDTPDTDPAELAPDTETGDEIPDNVVSLAEANHYRRVRRVARLLSFMNQNPKLCEDAIVYIPATGQLMYPTWNSNQATVGTLEIIKHRLIDAFAAQPPTSGRSG